MQLLTQSPYPKKSVRELADLAESKKNSYSVELKMAEAALKSGEAG